MDEDIITTQNNIKAQKEKAGLKWPGDSFVQTDAELNREPLLTWAPTIPKTHPMNYFVPNFGLDHDMIETKKSADLEEKLQKHDWVVPDPKSLPKPPPRDYFVPNFGLDNEIVTSISDLNEAEKTNGKWNLSQYQSFGQVPEGAAPLNISNVQLEEPKKERKMVKDQSKIDAKLKKIQNEETNNKDKK